MNETTIRKALPIGVESFEDFCTDYYYYVDKTPFIRELLDKKAKVNLFTRPRRFGKTLMLSTLQYYFEKAYDWRGNPRDYKHLFEGTAIMKAGETYTRHMGQYPVISLTLKSGRQTTLESCFSMLRTAIAGEFRRHNFIDGSGCLIPREEKMFRSLRDEEADISEYKKSLRFLSECLERYYGRNVIILIDEYDVPLENAFSCGFYPEMVDFIRELLGNALKTNPHLYFAVLTGCLRISKESIFTGLNNLDVQSILSMDYGEYFGFTEAEVAAMCRYYQLEDKLDELKDWYDGYTFAGVNVYNPWSTIKYVRDHVSKHDAYPVSYWANTSSNSIVRDLILRADDETRGEIEHLIAGGTICKPIHEDITYDEVYKTMDNLWNFMFFTGYFKQVGIQFDEMFKKAYASLTIPNGEVEYIFREKVTGWFQEKVQETDRSTLFSALTGEDAAAFEKELADLLVQTISFYDFQENFYHGFVAGVLTGMKGYMVRSNREAGYGRSDLFVKPVRRDRTAYVLEFKIADSIPDLIPKAEEAIAQIEARNYAQELYDDGYIEVHKYGISFFKKNCHVTFAD